jgi:hypothetical protein
MTESERIETLIERLKSRKGSYQWGQKIQQWWRGERTPSGSRPEFLSFRGGPPVEAAGAELRYLPSYSPDFNPIEQFFAKLKALLRKVAARTIEALIAAIAEALTKVSPQECENYLANQGYRRQL